jgi:hypothetical protein
MSAAATLRPEEVVLFEGDVVLLKSKINVVQTQGWITNQRLFVADGRRTVEKADIASVVEEKHGLDRKMVFGLRDGSSLALTAANRERFIAASKVLAGQSDVSSIPKEPQLAKVKNGTAWLAAFGPVIADAGALLLIVVIWGGDTDRMRFIHVAQLLAARIAVVWLFLRIDYLSLQGQGFNVKRLGIADPITFPFYLFSRAKAFGQGKGYAITWCVLVFFDLVAAIA